MHPYLLTIFQAYTKRIYRNLKQTQAAGGIFEGT